MLVIYYLSLSLSLDGLVHDLEPVKILHYNSNFPPFSLGWHSCPWQLQYCPILLALHLGWLMFMFNTFILNFHI